MNGDLTQALRSSPSQKKLPAEAIATAAGQTFRKLLKQPRSLLYSSHLRLPMSTDHLLS